MSNVVALPGTVVDDAPCQDIIDALEEALAAARAGRIASVGIAWADRHHWIDAKVVHSGLPVRHDLIAACVELLDRAKVAPR